MGWVINLISISISILASLDLENTIILPNAVSCVVNAATIPSPLVHSALPRPCLKLFTISHASAYCQCVFRIKCRRRR